MAATSFYKQTKYFYKRAFNFEKMNFDLDSKVGKVIIALQNTNNLSCKNIHVIP